jgi:hypothetical protein
MSGDWQSPGQQPALPPTGAPPGYGYNWGLAYPVPGYQPVAWIPRPRRPGVVNLALILILFGVLISTVQLVIGVTTTYANQDDLISQLNGGSGGTAPASVVHTAVGVGIGVAIALWLLPAAGAVVTGILSWRGANAARIVLASLMGVCALYDLCGGIFGLVNPVTNGISRVGAPAVSAAFDLVLAAVAVAIGVLVLVPPANRFFSAGPGRRFMPSR